MLPSMCFFCFVLGFVVLKNYYYLPCRPLECVWGLVSGVELSCWSTKACIKGHLPIVKILLEAILLEIFGARNRLEIHVQNGLFEIICWKDSNQQILDRNLLR